MKIRYTSGTCRRPGKLFSFRQQLNDFAKIGGDSQLKTVSVVFVESKLLISLETSGAEIEKSQRLFFVRGGCQVRNGLMWNEKNLALSVEDEITSGPFITVSTDGLPLL